MKPVEIAAKLDALKPAVLNYLQWTIKTGVNRSFFTNLHAGISPSVGMLQNILALVGVSVSEFFASAGE